MPSHAPSRRHRSLPIVLFGGALLAACTTYDGYDNYGRSPYYDPYYEAAGGDWYVVAGPAGRICYPVAYDPFYDASYFALYGYGWSPVNCTDYYRRSPYVYGRYSGWYGPGSPYWHGYYPGYYIGYYSGWYSGWYGGWNYSHYNYPGHYHNPYWGYYNWNHHDGHQKDKDLKTDKKRRIVRERPMRNLERDIARRERTRLDPDVGPRSTRPGVVRPARPSAAARDNSAPVRTFNPPSRTAPRKVVRPQPRVTAPPKQVRPPQYRPAPQGTDAAPQRAIEPVPRTYPQPGTRQSPPRPRYSTPNRGGPRPQVSTPAKPVYRAPAPNPAPPNPQTSGPPPSDPPKSSPPPPRRPKFRPRNDDQGSIRNRKRD